LISGQRRGEGDQGWCVHIDKKKDLVLDPLTKSWGVWRGGQKGKREKLTGQKNRKKVCTKVSVRQGQGKWLGEMISPIERDRTTEFQNAKRAVCNEVTGGVNEGRYRLGKGPESPKSRVGGCIQPGERGEPWGPGLIKRRLKEKKPINRWRGRGKKRVRASHERYYQIKQANKKIKNVTTRSSGGEGRT